MRNFTLKVLAAVAGLVHVAPALAATDVIWWHAMAGELGRQLEKLATDFNAAQPDYRIVPVYKGSYTESTTATISALHNIPVATRANGLGGLDAFLTINNPLELRHINQLAEWQKTKVFDYSGRDTRAEPRFQRGECGIFIGSSATRADILKNSKFEVGYGMMPYWPDVKGAPQNSIIGGATLWVLRDRPA